MLIGASDGEESRTSAEPHRCELALLRRPLPRSPTPAQRNDELSRSAASVSASELDGLMVLHSSRRSYQRWQPSVLLVKPFVLVLLIGIAMIAFVTL